MANRIQVDLIVDDKGTVHLKRFGNELDGTVQKAETGIKRADRALGGLAATIVSVASVYALARFGEKIISDASRLEETANKFNVVFRGQEAAAENWSRTLVDSFAMSTREAKQYLSSVQDLLKPMGMQADAAGKLSFEIVKLSADLGSFNNLPTARVMDDIQSALVGNYETMKKYGVVLNATVVQEEALAMGLAKTKDALTAADKAQAAYELIVKGSADAIGDMARTSDSYANQIKQLNANMEELSVTLGTLLLPPLTRVVELMNEAAQGWQFLLSNDQYTQMLKREQELIAEIEGLENRALRGISDPINRFFGQDPEEELARLRELLSMLQTYRRTMTPPGAGGGAPGGGGGGDALKDLQQELERLEKEAQREKLKEWEQFGKEEYAMYFASTREAEEKILAYKRQKSDEALEYRITQYERLGEQEAAMWGASAVSLETYKEQYAAFVESHGTLTEKMTQGIKDALDEQSKHAATTYDVMYAVTTEFAESSKLVMSTVLFDGIRGEFEDFGDYLDLFLDRMVNTWARAVSDMAIDWVSQLGADALAAATGGGGGGGGVMGFLEEIPIVGTIVSGIASLFHEGGIMGHGGRVIPLQSNEHVGVFREGEVVLTQEMLRGISTSDLPEFIKYLTAGGTPGVAGPLSANLPASVKSEIAQSVLLGIGSFGLLGSLLAALASLFGVTSAAPQLAIGIGGGYGGITGGGHEAAGGFGIGPGYQYGGIVPRDMVAKVHRGEGVFRPDQMSALAPVEAIAKAIGKELSQALSAQGRTGNISLNVNLDGRRIWSGMYEATSRRKARIHPRAMEDYLETVGINI